MARLGEIARPQDHMPESGAPWPEEIVSLKAGSLLAEVGACLIREAASESLGSGVAIACPEGSMRLMPCGLYAMELRLPEGFLRAASLKMAGWRGSVRTVIRQEMPDWNRQWSAHMGIAGCPEWPRAYLDSDADGMLVRLVGSAAADAVPERAGVWCVPSVDDEGGFEFPELLYPELVGAIADRLYR